MTGTWPLIAAALAASPASAPAAGEESRWTMPRIVGERCRAEGEEIVVCGRRDPDRYGVKDLGPEDAGAQRDRRLGLELAPGVRAEVEALQAARPDGLVDKRIMLHVKTKF